MILCKPFKCLSFLGGRKAPEEYRPVDAPGSGRPNSAEDDDEDGFFDDDWGNEAAGGTPSSAVAKSQGVERNPTRETTTKRSSSSGATSSSGSASGPSPAPKAPVPKKDVDFFGELGMEPEYKAPRTRVSSVAEGSATGAHAKPKTVARAPAKAAAPGPSVSEILGDDSGAVSGAGGAWGDDDLDLAL